jgi:L-rhamnonate dehydratase
VALGYHAQKWFFAYGPGTGWEGLQRNLAMARAVREAVGAGYPLMFDAFMGWDLTYATDMLRGLGDVEPYWVEEPVPPEHLSAFRRLALTSGIRLATGEHAYTRWQVRELLDSGVGLIQTDPDWTGGISEQVHICSLCSAYDVPVVAHGHAMAVPVHIAASRSPQAVPIVEYLVRIQERNQWFHRMAIHPVDGAISVPTEPGLGIDLDPTGSRIAEICSRTTQTGVRSDIAIMLLTSEVRVSVLRTPLGRWVFSEVRDRTRSGLFRRIPTG